ncbi:MAG: hypothetical protein SPK70_03005 [Succinivibrio dextrinosolvens]|nr:hypothetical protein [Succinivibrio dextrinosolvens]
MTNEELISLKKRPHVVLLGAGASCATIPNGDKFGRKICAMDGFLRKTGLSNLIDNLELETKTENLEDIFIELDKRSSQNDLFKEAKIKLEKGIRQAIASFQLPEHATIYDYLILSLSKKDLIATFNWDPMLVQAIRRISRYTRNTPKIAFLHGNVAAGYCHQCNLVGNKGARCPRCGSFLEDFHLLYPVKEKNYRKTEAISSAWDCLEEYLNKAFMLTIFGYSAPKSDAAAIEIMKTAWGNVQKRTIEEIEIVDIKDKDVALESWNDFIFADHYTYTNNFFETSLARYPRRSCESIYAQNFECEFLRNDMGFKDKSISIEDAYNHVKSLDQEENKSTTLTVPYIEN